MKQVDAKLYNHLIYNTKGRFCSYWHQIDEVIRQNPTEILEIGAGNQFVASFLRNAEYKVTTLDIDPDLKPDILGSVLDIPAPDNSFDVVMCCQVLEHLPYDNFIPALTQLHRVARNYIILSLPDMKHEYRVFVEIPKIRFHFLYPRPFFKPIKWEFNGEHYWNLNNKGFSLKRILNDLQRVNFIVEKHYRVFENPFHHFFILKKA